MLNVPKEIQAAIAAAQGQDYQGNDSVDDSEVFAISAQQKARAVVWAHLKPGDYIEGEGVYVGQWQPRDFNGTSLGNVFNVFAAPEDLGDEKGERKVFQYSAAVKRVSELKDWYGHNGIWLENDRALYKALREENYHGEWVIPTAEVLFGRFQYGRQTTVGNMLDHKDEGHFAGTFVMVRPSGHAADIGICDDWYWSCTESDVSKWYGTISFSDKAGRDMSWRHKNSSYLSCRPVRFVEVF